MASANHAGNGMSVHEPFERVTLTIPQEHAAMMASELRLTIDRGGSVNLGCADTRDGAAETIVELRRWLAEAERSFAALERLSWGEATGDVEITLVRGDAERIVDGLADPFQSRKDDALGGLLAGQVGLDFQSMRAGWRARQLAIGLAGD